MRKLRSTVSVLRLDPQVHSARDQGRPHDRLARIVAPRSTVSILRANEFPLTKHSISQLLKSAIPETLRFPESMRGCERYTRVLYCIESAQFARFRALRSCPTAYPGRQERSGQLVVTWAIFWAVATQVCCVFTGETQCRYCNHWTYFLRALANGMPASWWAANAVWIVELRIGVI